MRSLIIPFALLFTLLTACDSSSPSKTDQDHVEQALQLPDSLSSRRIQLALEIKKRVAAKVWKEFGVRRTEGPFIYFNKDESEIFFPDSFLLSKIGSYEEHSQDYVITERTDSIPYHFELMISLDPSDSNRLYFEHAVQQFISVEETKQFIPSVSSTEWWIGMVIHEMFHHFQYNEPNFFNYAKDELAPLDFDVRNLKTLCVEDQEFFQAVQDENELLIKAIENPSRDKKKGLIKDYLVQRAKRMEKYKEEYPLLEQIENLYIIQEGSARYVEYNSFLVFQELSDDSSTVLLEDDPMFNELREFQTIDLESDDFSFLTYAGRSTYHYAIGFNIMRLLDQFDPNYKMELMTHPEIGLHTYLEKI